MRRAYSSAHICALHIARVKGGGMGGPLMRASVMGRSSCLSRWVRGPLCRCAGRRTEQRRFIFIIPLVDRL